MSSHPIAELIDELGLSPAAVDVLLVIASPSLNEAVAADYLRELLHLAPAA